MIVKRAVAHLRGLRGRFTLLAVLLTAAVSVVLLVLAWLLVRDAAATVPQLPPGTKVRVDDALVDASALTAHLQQQAQNKVVVAGIIAFGCVVLAAGILAWALTTRVLRPLAEITATARRLSAESLHERIGPLRPRDELARLAETIDEMLDRLAHAFDSQRRFVANASHELRTPLTVIRTELDVTLSDPDADEAEYRRMAEVVRAAAQRAERLVSALLLLAKTDAAGVSAREPVDLAAVVRSAWEAVRPEAEERGLRVDMAIAPAPTMGDPALLERVAGNLLENAVRHNVDGGWITVHTTADATSAQLVVRSSGRTVDPASVPELFQPFHRGAGRVARSGAGLGLSIVRAAVEAHGGTVRAEPVDGGGLAVTVIVPST
ncbi:MULTISPECIES: HAMP domain-containing sensor histidine kinase [Thermocrispum]|uniref:histidine kinase n=2 Tax=Thermocrispum agreste TaxID=37925 RepID=A0ABD6FDT2_9PSEU|nr:MULTISPECIES: HAMP domain-containing sensor histidine kinase [Thermocrispum]